MKVSKKVIMMLVASFVLASASSFAGDQVGANDGKSPCPGQSDNKAPAQGAAPGGGTAPAPSTNNGKGN